MEPTVDVDEITQRAQRHWMEDGLTEMMLGLLMSTQMGLYMAAGALPLGFIFVAQALVLGITLAIVSGFKRLKARVSFPRTGYVAFPKPTWKLRISTWAIFATVFVVAEGLRGVEGLGTLMILVGLSMAILGGFRFRRYLKAHPRPQETEA